jgi:hypothetical protein
MNKLIFAAFAATTTTALTVCAALYGDTPNATHAWGVHDMNRPRPKVIQAEPGKPPSDAIVLFDGTSLDAWCMGRNETEACKWKIVDGAMEAVKGTGEVRTKQSFGDCQLHIEWAAPIKVEGAGQGRGNSGVFLMGMHEIQVLDCYENETYADGQTASVYGENPPLVNACRKPGEFQTYDIIFHQPVWEGSVMKHPGSVTVLHNGVLVQDHWEFEGTSTHMTRRPLKGKYAEKLPLRLQDHGNPVRFRNIWIREIPSRYANTTHGGPGVKEADVMALRKETAAALEKKITWDAPNKFETLRQALEVVSYEKTPERMGPLAKLADAYLEELAKLDAEALKNKKGEIITLRNDTNVLIRNGVFADTCKLRAGLQKIIAEQGFEKKR